MHALEQGGGVVEKVILWENTPSLRALVKKNKEEEKEERKEKEKEEKVAYGTMDELQALSRKFNLTVLTPLPPPLLFPTSLHLFLLLTPILLDPLN